MKTDWLLQFFDALHVGKSWKNYAFTVLWVLLASKLGPFGIAMIVSGCFLYIIATKVDTTPYAVKIAALLLSVDGYLFGVSPYVNGRASSTGIEPDYRMFVISIIGLNVLLAGYYVWGYFAVIRKATHEE